MTFISRLFIMLAVLMISCGSVRAESDPLCGPECLYTALVALDSDPGNYASFLQRVGAIDARGTSLGRLAEVAEEFGLSTLLVQTSLENLQLRETEPPFVCIAHVDGNHFVLIGEVQSNSVWVIDPPGEGLVAAPLFRQRWKGHALLIARSQLRAETDLPRSSGSWIPWWTAASVALLLSGAIIYWRRRHQ